VAKNANNPTSQTLLLSGRLKHIAMSATHTAKVMECVNPRRPHCEEYGIPNLKANVSKSGRIAQIAEKTNKRRLIALPTPKLVAIGTTACEKIDGNG
jgi:hypothetical protein